MPETALDIREIRISELVYRIAITPDVHRRYEHWQEIFQLRGQQLLEDCRRVQPQ